MAQAEAKPNGYRRTAEMIRNETGGTEKLAEALREAVEGSLDKKLNPLMESIEKMRSENLQMMALWKEKVLPMSEQNVKINQEIGRMLRGEPPEGEH